MVSAYGFRSVTFRIQINSATHLGLRRKTVSESHHDVIAHRTQRIANQRYFQAAQAVYSLGYRLHDRRIEEFISCGVSSRLQNVQTGIHLPEHREISPRR